MTGEILIRRPIWALAGRTDWFCHEMFVIGNVARNLDSSQLNCKDVDQHAHEYMMTVHL